MLASIRVGAGNNDVVVLCSFSDEMAMLDGRQIRSWTPFIYILYSSCVKSPAYALKEIWICLSSSHDPGVEVRDSSQRIVWATFR